MDLDALDALLVAEVDSLEAAAPPDPAFGGFFGELRDFLINGGKRLRPQFVWWGFRAAGGDPAAAEAVLPVAAAIELVHACALIHDDVMDASPLRRNRPTAHEAFRVAHTGAGWQGDARHFGVSAAIMLGDLALVLADAVFARGRVDPADLGAAFVEYTHMRVEVIEGQYLDLVDGNRAKGDTATALHVAALKTAKYTVERPLRIGACLAGAAPTTLSGLSGFGEPLGIAFQLRDDLLGAFGDTAVTGKPAGIDFREAKHTYLMALARELATPPQAAELDGRVGDPDLDDEGIDAVRKVLTETGAAAECEARITALTTEALGALAGLSAEAEVEAALTDLAHRCAYRHA